MTRAQGSPRFTVGPLETLIAKGTDFHAAAIDRVSGKLADRVHQGLARFGPSCLALVELLAVAEAPVDLGDLAQITGHPIEDVELALERLLCAEVVVKQPPGEHASYEVANPRTREVLYAGITDARRCVLHRKVAERLLESGRAQEAASHFARAAQAGEELAARQLLSEAEQAGDQRGIAEALGVLGPALGWQGRFDAAEKALTRSIELSVAAARGSWMSRNLALLASFDACRGHLDSARARWTQANVSSPHYDPVIGGCGALIELLAGNLAMAEAHAKQTDVPTPATRSCLPVRRAVWAAMVAAERGHVTDARRSLEAMAPTDGSLGVLRSWYWWADGVVTRAEGRLSTAVSALQRAVDGCHATNTWALRAFVLADLAEVSVIAGDRDAAAGAVTSAEDDAHRTGEPIHQALHLLVMAWALAGHGDSDRAVGVALHAADTFGSCGYPLLAARSRVAYASAIRRSDRPAAEAALREATATFDACGAVLRHDQARALLAQLGSDGPL
ncbi:MAG: hypothetical protein ACRDQH_07280, partial [Pseudonocardiaceae bacterium]